MGIPVVAGARNSLLTVVALALALAAALGAAGCAPVDDSADDAVTTTTTTQTSTDPAAPEGDDNTVPTTQAPSTETSSEPATTTDGDTGEPAEPAVGIDAVTVARPDGFINLVATNFEGDFGGETRTESDLRIVVVTGAVGDMRLVTYGVERQPLATTAVADLPAPGGSPATPLDGVVVTDVIHHDDAFWLFTMGYESTSRTATMAPLWRSADGVDWVPVETTVTVRAAQSPSTGPASLPAPGPAGVTAADATERHGLVAVGWATFDLNPEAVIWRSGDGERWTVERLPTLGGVGPEFGADVAVSQLHTVVNVGNGTADGAGVVGARRRAVPNDLVELDPPRGRAGTDVVASVQTNDSYAYISLYDLENQTNRLLWSEDLRRWTEVAFPDPPEGAGSEWRIEASTWHDPVAWIDYRSIGNTPAAASLWTLDRGRWEETVLDGDTIVSVDAAHIATTSGDDLFVVSRAANR